MKITLLFYHLLAFLLLIAAAALQLNDPDPVLWAAFYTSCSLIPLLAFFRVNTRIPYTFCIIYGVAVLATSIDGFFEYPKHTEPLLQGMNPDKPYVEEAREFLGAMIAIGLITVSLVGQNRATVRNSN
jgi:hypothetical protein